MNFQYLYREKSIHLKSPNKYNENVPLRLLFNVIMIKTVS